MDSTGPGELAVAFETALAPQQEPLELGPVTALLPLEPGLVLDAMAGTGSLLVPLLEAGYGVHGAEASPACFAELDQRVRATGRTTDLFRQDVASLNLPFRYRAAFVGLGRLQGLPTPRLAAGLARMRAHLVPPGTLLVGFVIPEVATRPPGAATVEIERARLADGSTITRRCELAVDIDARCIERRERYERRQGLAVIGREDTHRRIAWYPEEQAVDLVTGAGFHGARVEPVALHEAAGLDRAFLVVANG